MNLSGCNLYQIIPKQSFKNTTLYVHIWICTLIDWQVIVGDQDQFVHLWRYEGGYHNLDENLRYKQKKTVGLNHGRSWIIVVLILIFWLQKSRQQQSEKSSTIIQGFWVRTRSSRAWRRTWTPASAVDTVNTSSSSVTGQRFNSGLSYPKLFISSSKEMTSSFEISIITPPPPGVYISFEKHFLPPPPHFPIFFPQGPPARSAAHA